MGEYAIRKSDNTEIKIGTCETMYYIRYEDRYNVKTMENNIDCSKETGLFWRIPFPDEDNIKIGDYEPYYRGHLLYLFSGFKAEDADKDKGTIQLLHKSGLMLNVTCYHGEKLPKSTAEIKPFWNGRDPNAYELISVKNNPTEIRYVVRCKFCEKMRSFTWDEIKDYINDPILKARLEAYNQGAV
jgi:hypothetical protein